LFLGDEVIHVSNVPCLHWIDYQILQSVLEYMLPFFVEDCCATINRSWSSSALHHMAAINRSWLSSVLHHMGAKGEECWAVINRSTRTLKEIQDMMSIFRQVIFARIQTDCYYLVPQSDSSKGTIPTTATIATAMSQVAVSLVPQSDSSKGTMSSVTLDINKASKSATEEDTHWHSDKDYQAWLRAYDDSLEDPDDDPYTEEEEDDSEEDFRNLEMMFLASASGNECDP
jgi:hypothetical protein